MNTNEKVSKGVRMLKEQGDFVEGVLGQQMRWEIDHRMRQSQEFNIRGWCLYAF